MKPKLFETIHTQQYETIKFLDEKYTISLLDLRLGNGFLNMTPNALVTKEKRSIY